MTAAKLLADLARAGVTMYLVGDRLRSRARAGALTLELRAQVAANRAAIVAALQAAPSPADPAPQDTRKSAQESGQLPAFDPATDKPPAHWRAVADAVAPEGLAGRFGMAIAGELLAAAQVWEAAWSQDDAAGAATAYAAAWARALAAERPSTPLPTGNIPAPQAPAPGPLGPTPVAPPAWPADVAALLPLLDGPVPVGAFDLRPGVTVENPAGFVAGLRRDVAAGPTGVRCRRGLLARDLAGLAAAVEAGRCKSSASPMQAADGREVPFDGPDRIETATSSQRPGAAVSTMVETTPAEHLAAIGGWEGAAARFGPERGHRLWDAARLWVRDLGTPRAARWAAEYEAALMPSKEAAT